MLPLDLRFHAPRRRNDRLTWVPAVRSADALPVRVSTLSTAAAATPRMASVFHDSRKWRGQRQNQFYIEIAVIVRRQGQLTSHPFWFYDG